MMEMLNPAAEFEYSPRVRELFADLKHAGSLPVGAVRKLSSCVVDMKEGGSRNVSTQMETVFCAIADSREQGASVQLYAVVRDAHIQTIRYQAYGCPHFLAACESVALWLEGRSISEFSQWSWRAVETELAVPAGKRSRLLLLDEAVTALYQSILR